MEWFFDGLGTELVSMIVGLLHDCIRVDVRGIHETSVGNISSRQRYNIISFC